MNYKDFNDYELLDYTYSCNEDANEILLYKYRPLIVSIATKMIKYSSGGVDLNDLIQEGMLGLNEAINSYDENNTASFGTYAKICVERKIASMIKSTKRYKNKILNESLALEIDDDDLTIDKFLVDTESNPSDLVINYIWEKDVLDKLNQMLTDSEKKVFELKMSNFNYKEIAEILDKTPKSVDSTLQRIKEKLKKVMKDS